MAAQQYDQMPLLRKPLSLNRVPVSRLFSRDHFIKPPTSGIRFGVYEDNKQRNQMIRNQWFRCHGAFLSFAKNSLQPSNLRYWLEAPSFKIKLPPKRPYASTAQESSSSWANGVAAQAIVGSLGGVLILGFGGYAYHSWYKYSVLQKMAVAFEPGNDPVLVLHSASQRASPNPGLARPTYTPSYDSEEIAWIPRQEQALIDQIIHGKLAGQYWFIAGPKGTGKFSLMADAMERNQADGVAVCECSDNLEIFRLRLGKCLNFEYAEDYIGGLFSRRDPREGGPLVDIERALNKLEKVAIDFQSKNKRPIVLVLNNMHHLQQDADSRSLLLQLQQRAETWAQAGIVTMVFSSDDLWPYTFLRNKASRMSTLMVKDLTKTEALRAIRAERKKIWMENRASNDPEIEAVWNLIGGRIAHLTHCVKQKDMVRAAQYLLECEKQWLLSRIGLIVDCDDDVMDEQKWSSASFLLMQALVEQAEEEVKSNERADELSMPKGIPFSEARQVMTRTDFLSQLDHENMISIDLDYHVRPNSMALLNVIKEICHQPDFQDRLDKVLERIGDIESLGRTRELTWKSGKDGDGIMNIKLERDH
ncbi:hypothetical protein O181_027684 [Austropuccinia psidii MF-1]|uniref:AAA protein C-terminal winged helix domain-containing protein n=1 Tax=Austropuccinia psidii MF-1 TaxID=1389203 RepID=A0A9Q3CPE6_9BASI|nr:hypothetical protein [Austropuccinia psidii MF-1]